VFVGVGVALVGEGAEGGHMLVRTLGVVRFAGTQQRDALGAETDGEGVDEFAEEAALLGGVGAVVAPAGVLLVRELHDAAGVDDDAFDAEAEVGFLDARASEGTQVLGVARRAREDEFEADGGRVRAHEFGFEAESALLAVEQVAAEFIEEIVDGDAHGLGVLGGAGEGAFDDGRRRGLDGVERFGRGAGGGVEAMEEFVAEARGEGETRDRAQLADGFDAELAKGVLGGGAEAKGADGERVEGGVEPFGADDAAFERPEAGGGAGHDGRGGDGGARGEAHPFHGVGDGVEMPTLAVEEALAAGDVEQQAEGGVVVGGLVGLDDGAETDRPVGEGDEGAAIAAVVVFQDEPRRAGGVFFARAALEFGQIGAFAVVGGGRQQGAGLGDGHAGAYADVGAARAAVGDELPLTVTMREQQRADAQGREQAFGVAGRGGRRRRRRRRCRRGRRDRPRESASGQVDAPLGQVQRQDVSHASTPASAFGRRLRAAILCSARVSQSIAVLPRVGSSVG